MKRFILIVAILASMALVISTIALYFTNKDFATELRQVSQPKRNTFHIGIDVSRTMRPDILADFKDALISRLENLIGEKKVFYHISIFGLPGCGKETIADIVSTQSPEDPASFSRRVEKRIRNIRIATGEKADADEAPLGSPLFFFLEKILTEKIGERVIIFSNLVNNDSGCQKQYPFPVKAITRFGTNKEGQIIFLYPTPYSPGRYKYKSYYGIQRITPKQHEGLIKKQLNFMIEMQKLSSSGKARVFFYYIPNDPQRRLNFLRSQLQDSIPATIFEVIWERLSKIVDTVVGAVRG